MVKASTHNIAMVHCLAAIMITFAEIRWVVVSFADPHFTHLRWVTSLPDTLSSDAQEH